MGQVDLADQYRAGNLGLCRIRHGGWHALFRFLFNTVLVNSYLLSSYANGKGGRGVGQKAFRKKLVSQLFELGRAEAQKQKMVISHANPLIFAALDKHVQVRREREQDCRGCALIGQLWCNSWRAGGQQEGLQYNGEAVG
jgi:hypothetical protein